MLDVSNWTHEMQEEAEEIRDEASLLLDQNVTMREGRTSEYPDVPSSRKAIIRPAKKGIMKKSNRKNIQKESRKKNRRK